MARKEKFYGYGDFVEPAFAWMDNEYVPPSVDEMQDNARRFLSSKARSESALKPWHRPFEPITTSKDWILATDDTVYTIAHSPQAEVLDALAVLFWCYLLKWDSVDDDKKDSEWFNLGRAWEKFQARQTGVERLAVSQSNSIGNLPKQAPTDLTEAWRTALGRFPDGPKQRQIEAVMSIAKCSESTVKRWLKKICN